MTRKEAARMASEHSDDAKPHEQNAPRRSVVSAVILGLLSILAVLGMVAAYAYYRDSLQQSTERQLTVMAESASANLTNFLELRLRELDLQFSDDAVALSIDQQGAKTDAKTETDAAGESDAEAEAAVQGLVDSFSVPDASVKSIEFVSADSETEDASAVAEYAGASTAAHVGSWYQDGTWYALELEKSIVVQGNTIGTVVETLDLGKVYNETLGSIQVGDRGYCTVKDADNVIIMHRLASQIGVNAQADRVEQYAQGDWQGLFADQFSGSSGCDIVTSYWWDEMDAGPARKFIAYAPAQVGDAFFVVNVVMSYDELMQPLQRMFVLCAALGAVIVVMVAIGGWHLAKSVQNERHLRRELAYEKQLREQTRRLKLQDRQIQHIDRLQTMGIVTSSLAHEMKNDLTPLIIYGGMLKEGGLTDEEQAEASSEVLRLSQKCSDTFEHMLSYVRDRSSDGGEALFDVRAEISSEIAIIKVLCPRDVRLEVDIEDFPSTVRGDRHAVSQILLNLVNNALYAMKESGGVLGISWRADPEKPGFGVLSVADTGCGMDEQTQRMMFPRSSRPKAKRARGWACWLSALWFPKCTAASRSKAV